MPRRDGDVFRFGTAMASHSCNSSDRWGWRAYRRTRRLRLVGADTGIQVRKIGGTALINAGQLAHGRARRPGAAANRIGQDRGKLRRLYSRQTARRLVEGVARRGLGAEFTVRSPLGDV